MSAAFSNAGMWEKMQDIQKQEATFRVKKREMETKIKDLSNQVPYIYNREASLHRELQMNLFYSWHLCKLDAISVHTNRKRLRRNCDHIEVI